MDNTERKWLALSDIAKHLGLIRSGELRFGNRKEPGKGFTGVRFGYPFFIYGTDEYIFVVVQNDVAVGGVLSSGMVSFGHVYGSFYADDIAKDVVIAATHTHELIDSSMTGGTCNGMTFVNGRELECVYPGTYLVTWSMSISSSLSDNTIEGLVMVNSVGQENTINAARAKENGVVYSVSGTGIVTLNKYDLLQLGLECETLPATVTVNHANLSAVKL